jgi:hypothetical protein
MPDMALLDIEWLLCSILDALLFYYIKLISHPSLQHTVSKVNSTKIISNVTIFKTG